MAVHSRQHPHIEGCIRTSRRGSCQRRHLSGTSRTTPDRANVVRPSVQRTQRTVFMANLDEIKAVVAEYADGGPDVRQKACPCPHFGCAHADTRRPVYTVPVCTRVYCSVLHTIVHAWIGSRVHGMRTLRVLYVYAHVFKARSGARARATTQVRTPRRMHVHVGDTCQVILQLAAIYDHVKHTHTKTLPCKQDEEYNEELVPVFERRFSEVDFDLLVERVGELSDHDKHDGIVAVMLGMARNILEASEYAESAEATCAVDRVYSVCDALKPKEAAGHQPVYAN